MNSIPCVQNRTKNKQTCNRIFIEHLAMNEYYTVMETVVGMNSFSQELLRSAEDALRKGKDSYARLVLAWLLRKEPDNAVAWLMLARAVDTLEQRYDCLQRALDLTGNHPVIREQVYQLERTITGKNCSAPETKQPWPETSELMPLADKGKSIVSAEKTERLPALGYVNSRHLLMLSGLCVIMFAYVFG